MLRNVFRSLYQRDAVLAIAGLSQVVATVIALPLLFIDSREVLGINVWIKPIKFFLSSAIYLWTLAILLAHLKSRYPRSVRFISWSVTVAMVVENVAISYQAARGVKSHFNGDTVLRCPALQHHGLIHHVEYLRDYLCSRAFLSIVVLVANCLYLGHSSGLCAIHFG